MEKNSEFSGKRLGIVNLAGVHEFISESRKIADLHFSSSIVRDAMEYVVAALKDSSDETSTVMKELLAEIRSKIKEVQFIIPPEEMIEGSGDYSFPNQLLFEFKGVTDEIEGRLQEAVNGFFRKTGEKSYAKLEKTDNAPFELWLRQWSDGLPLYFTSVELKDDFADAHQQLQKKLIAHKMNRRFTQWQGAPVPKCIQCGHRECFGPQESMALNSRFWETDAATFIKQNILKGNERLCAVCLGKRLAAVEKNRSEFIPTTTFMAARPFLKEMASGKRDAAVHTKWDIFQKNALNVSTGLPTGFSDKFKKIEHMKDFDAEKFKQNAEWFYEEFYSINSFKNLDLSNSQEFGRNLSGAKAALGALLKEAEIRPSKYLALVEYDGDKMGEKRGVLPSEILKKVSTAISGLAKQGIKEIFEQHDGFLIYSGGEDVLGFIPMQNALPLSKGINDLFTGTINKHVGTSTAPFTGSGSITIFPHDFPLQMALQLSGENLKRAKDEFGRDSLVVGAVLPDSSQYITGSRWRIPQRTGQVEFTDWLEGTLALFGRDGATVNNRKVLMSRAFLYELMDLVTVFEDKQKYRLFWNTSEAAFKAEALRLIKRHVVEKSVLKDPLVIANLESRIHEMTHAVLTQHHTRPLHNGLSNQKGLLKFIDFYQQRVEGASE